ncbi:MAG: H-NS histone family protein [Yoonia sp.]|uniref:H-NS histone family protein n=1 Tax=Rhodobacterales TaxID=204455 RepID=UPI001FF24D3F|nr:H-NS histone family protein [Loktanella sp. F6476L]MCK0120218.1 H-NS histone family protein [Loktanella sp. F6476L]UWQ99006.1 H-NS histone family protein [Rhodobacteraceae bacterium S2214]
MKINLKGMSRKELEKLQKDVDKALARIGDKELKAVRDEAAKLAAKHGYTLADITGDAPVKKARKAAGPKTKAPAKYANPSDKSQTWTGKGRQPVWYKEAVSSGTAPEAMEI